MNFTGDEFMIFITRLKSKNNNKTPSPPIKKFKTNYFRTDGAVMPKQSRRASSTFFVQKKSLAAPINQDSQAY
jgi:hypothetical protein